MTSAAPSRLTALARQARVDADARLERCELCSVVIEPEHRHVLDLSKGELLCSCRPCALLFDRDGVPSGQLRAVSERRLALPPIALDDERWAALGVPVEMAFFVRSSSDSKVRALYPSPAGATEATLDATAWWEGLVADSPALPELADDVEALLVDRVRGRRRCFVVGIDVAYRLVALVRTGWRGITGGTPMWKALDSFFDDLQQSARPLAKAARGSPQGGGKELR
ncbi:MAG TPA: DUF5947 family protein [Conexibacter sp.]|jgi:hypothetical protein